MKLLSYIECASQLLRLLRLAHLVALVPSRGGQAQVVEAQLLVQTGAEIDVACLAFGDLL